VTRLQRILIVIRLRIEIAIATNVGYHSNSASELPVEAAKSGVDTSMPHYHILGMNEAAHVLHIDRRPARDRVKNRDVLTTPAARALPILPWPKPLRRALCVTPFVPSLFIAPTSRDDEYVSQTDGKALAPQAKKRAERVFLDGGTLSNLFLAAFLKVIAI
jgi:hypothetical protein